MRDWSPDGGITRRTRFSRPDSCAGSAPTGRSGMDRAASQFRRRSMKRRARLGNGIGSGRGAAGSARCATNRVLPNSVCVRLASAISDSSKSGAAISSAISSSTASSCATSASPVAVSTCTAAETASGGEAVTAVGPASEDGTGPAVTASASSSTVADGWRLFAKPAIARGRHPQIPRSADRSDRTRHSMRPSVSVAARLPQPASMALTCESIRS